MYSCGCICCRFQFVHAHHARLKQGSNTLKPLTSWTRFVITCFSALCVLSVCLLCFYIPISHYSTKQHVGPICMHVLRIHSHFGSSCTCGFPGVVHSCLSLSLLLIQFSCLCLFSKHQHDFTIQMHCHNMFQSTSTVHKTRNRQRTTICILYQVQHLGESSHNVQSKSKTDIWDRWAHN